MTLNFLHQVNWVGWFRVHATTIMSRRKQLRPFKVQDDDDDDSNAKPTKSADNGLSTSSNGHNTAEGRTSSKFCIKIKHCTFYLFEDVSNQFFFKFPINLLKIKSILIRHLFNIMIPIILNRLEMRYSCSKWFYIPICQHWLLKMFRWKKLRFHQSEKRTNTTNSLKKMTIQFRSQKKLWLRQWWWLRNRSIKVWWSRVPVEMWHAIDFI